MQINAQEILGKLKELRNTSSETELKLEKDGLGITNIAKEQLINYNIKSIISSVEGLLRNEPQERHVLRLEKDIPDAYNNIGKLKETGPGRMNSVHLDKIKDLIAFIEKNYKRI